jgi:predicted TIM-barrel fold metal-dependent hydrolase
LVTALLTHLDSVGLQNVVLVQPHSHGTDTRAMMSALSALGNRGRAVTVVDPQRTSVDELAHARQVGVRGVRFNIHTAGTQGFGDVVRVCDRLAHMVGEADLHLQLFATGTQLRELVAAILKPGRTRVGPVAQVVVDHLGMAMHAGGDGLEIAKSLADHGCWIKLSAPERMGIEPDDPRVQDLVNEYASRAPDRILWGSDWPHSALVHGLPISETEEFRQVDDPARLATMRRWLGDSLVERMLVVNPRKLYD